MLNNNKIYKIEDGWARYLPNLNNLLLTNNKIQSIEDIEKIGKFSPNLERLSLVGNIVTNIPNYRLYTIHQIPSLKVLDFQNVTDKEREAAQELFGDEPKESEAYLTM